VARIRTIKPSFFSSLTIASLPISTRLTFIGLWTYVDDEGRAIDDARLIKAELWPLDDRYTVKHIGSDLERLAESGLIERYVVADRHYLQVTGWAEHQRINRPNVSKFPDRDGNVQCALTEHSVNGHGSLTERSLLERKGKEGKGKEPPLTPPVPSPQPVDNSAGGGHIEQALALAADRYAQDQVTSGKATNATGLAHWWTQTLAPQARIRANTLLSEYNLTVTQLADALLSPNPPWLRHYRKPRETA
jgi:hypothetical protein